MTDHRSVVSLDIETDTTVNGLDPNVAAITEIAVYDGTSGDVFAGDEADMLADVIAWLDARNPGLIVTWNGSVFDLPFIDARSRLHTVDLQLELTYDPELPVKYQPTPGYLGGYQATWRSWTHFDIAGPYRPFAARRDVTHSLKPVARAAGFEPVELDRERIHTYSAADRRTYALSDAVVTRDLYVFGLAAGLFI